MQGVQKDENAEHQDQQSHDQAGESAGQVESLQVVTIKLDHFAQEAIHEEDQGQNQDDPNDLVEGMIPSLRQAHITLADPAGEGEDEKVDRPPHGFEERVIPVRGRARGDAG